MYDICVAWPGWLSRILLWLWQSKRRQVCQRISVVNEMESEWTAHYRPGISTKILCDRWQPSVYQLIKHHVGQVAVRYASLGTFSHLLLFRNLTVYFSFSQGKKEKEKGPGSTVLSAGGGRVGESVTTPPTQSWSSTVFKMEKQSQKSSHSQEKKKSKVIILSDFLLLASSWAENIHS